MTVDTTGRIATTRPARYLEQLAAHLRHRLTVDVGVHAGTIQLGDAVAHFIAATSSLEVTVASSTDADAHLLMGVIGSHLDRFAEREGAYFVWDDPAQAAAAAVAAALDLRERQEAVRL